MKKRVSHTGLDQQEGEQITTALLSGWKSYIPLTVCSTPATLGFKTAMKNTSSSLIYLRLWCGLGISKRPRLFVWYHVVPKRLIISLISLSCTVGKRGRHGGSCLDWLEKRTQRCNYLDDCRQWLSALIKIRLTAQQGVGISGDSVVCRPIQQTNLDSLAFDIWSKSRNMRSTHKWSHSQSTFWVLIRLTSKQGLDWLYFR